MSELEESGVVSPAPSPMIETPRSIAAAVAIKRQRYGTTRSVLLEHALQRPQHVHVTGDPEHLAGLLQHYRDRTAITTGFMRRTIGIASSAWSAPVPSAFSSPAMSTRARSR